MAPSTLYSSFLACCGVMASRSTWCMLPNSPRSMSLSAGITKLYRPGAQTDTKPVCHQCMCNSAGQQVPGRQRLLHVGLFCGSNQLASTARHKAQHSSSINVARRLQDQMQYLPSRGHSMTTQRAGSCMHAMAKASTAGHHVQDQAACCCVHKAPGVCELWGQQNRGPHATLG